MSVYHPSAKPVVEPIPYSDSGATYFAQIRHLDLPIWLDSCHPYTQQGRFDIIAASPTVELVTRGGLTQITEHDAKRQWESAEDPFQLLQNAMPQACAKARADGQILPFCGGALGYFGYDLARRLESIPSVAAEDLSLPDMHLGIYPWAIVLDHHKQKAWLTGLPDTELSSVRALITAETKLKSILENTNESFKISHFKSTINKKDYIEKFDIVHNHIREGNCYQINLTQRFSAGYTGDLYPAYLALREASPAPFAGFMQLPQGAVLSLSPERFIACDGTRATTSPIKGTVARSLNPDEDQTNAQRLLASEKDRAENLMIVDLLRNDFSRCCSQVTTPELFALQSFANVHHLVSRVEGVLKPEQTPIKLLRAAFPGGSITGAPKVRAMQIIESLESHRRGVYCGSLGYISACGNMDTSITIRTLSGDGEKLVCWGGGGIVADSTADSEYEESITKVRLLMRTLEEAFA
ncbi:aminodeoxychorismate synthase component I [Gilvimarinus xylanilyticus]|uniref:aminodeoxychorismate synthase n=1 Tax=Gilvimarinus xylanilyticus TaxID=2944139 RepID=A0A9X2I0Q5_9GAMM|nr:aminodeoxychorismate synthase component I [Gilvimarinus xylanilyticus]MCP8898508.1 aminodeoxychorismate synthase component I [Gilvimarinus xylanilyticus]